MMVWNGENVISQGNVTGADNSYLSLASNAGFVVGETVTGGTSGATSVIYSVSPTNSLSVTDTITGTFSPGETVTGGTSGASSTLTSVNNAEVYSQSFLGITNLWHGRNVNLYGKSEYKNTIGTEVAI